MHLSAVFSEARSTRSPGVVLQVECRSPNWSPLNQQWMLLSIEPFLQPQEVDILAWTWVGLERGDIVKYNGQSRCCGLDMK